MENQLKLSLFQRMSNNYLQRFIVFLTIRNPFAILVIRDLTY